MSARLVVYPGRRLAVRIRAKLAGTSEPADLSTYRVVMQARDKRGRLVLSSDFTPEPDGVLAANFDGAQTSTLSAGQQGVFEIAAVALGDPTHIVSLLVGRYEAVAPVVKL